MSKFNATPVAMLAGLALLAACSGPQPVAYSGLASAQYLKPNFAGPAKIPYAYTMAVNWPSYSKVIVDPVVIYQGPDNQFGNMSAADQTALADYMQTVFSKKLSSRFAVTQTPDTGTLRIRLTLTGARKSTPFFSSFAHIDMGGNLYNAVQAVRGEPGLLTGSVMFSVEIYDAQTGQLLDAYVTKQYPNAENIGASFGGLSAAKTGIDKGADALVGQLG